MSEKKEMTREEAITCLQEKYDYCKSFYGLAAHPEEDYPEMTKYLQALQIALSALLPITREQVEKMRGEIVETVEKGRMKRVFSCCGCDFTSLTCWITPKFCPSCGAPMTDEAVETIMKRMEEMRND